MNTKKDRLSSPFFLFLAIGICIGSLKLDIGTLHAPGPGFFSFLAGAILGLLSLSVFIQSFKSASAGETERFWPAGEGGGKRILFALIVLILYGIGMNYIGFFISTLLFLGAFLRIVGRQRWPTVLLVSLFGTLVSYGIFDFWLDISFPVGVIAFH